MAPERGQMQDSDSLAFIEGTDLRGEILISSCGSQDYWTYFTYCPFIASCGKVVRDRGRCLIPKDNRKWEESSVEQRDCGAASNRRKLWGTN